MAETKLEAAIRECVRVESEYPEESDRAQFFVFQLMAVHREELVAAEEAQIAETVKFLRHVNDPAAEALAEYEKTHSTGALGRHDAELIIAAVDWFLNWCDFHGVRTEESSIRQGLNNLASSAANSPERKPAQ